MDTNDMFEVPGNRLREMSADIERSRTEVMDLTRVVIALARRQGGVLIFSEAELDMDGLPAGTGISRMVYPDGRIIFRVVNDDPESGSAS